MRVKKRGEYREVKKETRVEGGRGSKSFVNRIAHKTVEKKGDWSEYKKVGM